MVDQITGMAEARAISGASRKAAAMIPERK